MRKTQEEIEIREQMRLIDAEISKLLRHRLEIDETVYTLVALMEKCQDKLALLKDESKIVC